MLYTLLTFLFIIGIMMFLGGYFWRTANSGGVSDVGTDVASAIALLVVYAAVMIAVDSAPEFAQSICGGLPYVSAIADYGSLANVWKKAPNVFAASFFDVVLLSGIVDVLKPLLGAGKRVPKSMTKLFSGLVAALIGLILLNVVVKKLDAYSSVVSIAGALISAFSVTGFGFTALTSLTRRQITSGMFAVVALTMNNPISAAIRMSFAKAVIYVMIIWLMERFCGSLTGGVSLLLNIAIAFAPVVILLFGIGLILKSLKK